MRGSDRQTGGMNDEIFIDFLWEDCLVSATGILTVPSPCSSAASSTSIDSGDTPFETSSKTDVATIEEINEIFQEQIQKLEDSSSMEVRFSHPIVFQ